MNERAISDIGGQRAGHVDTNEHRPTLSERNIDAMFTLLRAKPREYFVVDELRRAIEEMTPSLYEGAAYYERWVTAISALLVEHGVLAAAEVEAKLADVRARYKGDAS